MCIVYTRKYTLCGCIWDDSLSGCKYWEWCRRRRLIQSEYETRCGECSEKITPGTEQQRQVGDALQSAQDGGPKESMTRETECDLSRSCDPVVLGKRVVKRRTQKGSVTTFQLMCFLGSWEDVIFSKCRFRVL
jgi:hypothetical protein